MSNSAMEEVFGVLRVVKQQQEGLDAALKELASEREAIESDRINFARYLNSVIESLGAATGGIKDAVNQVEGAAGTVTRAAKDAVPLLADSTKAAVADSINESVKHSMARISDTAAEALTEATKPVVSQLEGAARSASKAERALQNAGKWFAWKWVAMAAGGAIGVCLVAYASFAWQFHQFDKLSDKKAAMEADIAALEANVARLEKEGGRIQLEQCKIDEKRNRLCVRVSSTQGGKMKDYRGPFKNEAETASFVIPYGY